MDKFLTQANWESIFWRQTDSLNIVVLRLWLHLNAHRRMQFGALSILMMFASFAEILSIGAVVPFLSVLTAPEQVFEHSLVSPIVSFFRFSEPEQMMLLWFYGSGHEWDRLYCRIWGREGKPASSAVLRGPMDRNLIAIVNKALVDIGYLYPLVLLLSW